MCGLFCTYVRLKARLKPQNNRIFHTSNGRAQVYARYISCGRLSRTHTTLNLARFILFFIVACLIKSRVWHSIPIECEREFPKGNNKEIWKEENRGSVSCLRNQFHKDNLRHLPRFPDFFVTFRILSPGIQFNVRHGFKEKERQ